MFSLESQGVFGGCAAFRENNDSKASIPDPEGNIPDKEAITIVKELIQVPYFEKLYKNDELPQTAKLVYIYLYDRQDKEGKPWPNVKRIAHDLSISGKTVRRAVKDFQQAGLVEKEYAY